eukprot:2668980-Pleurochrysis_carterae.AAC.1
MAASEFPEHQVHASANSSASGWRSNEWQRRSAGKHERERTNAARVEASSSVGAEGTPQELSSAARMRATILMRSGDAWSRTAGLEVLPSRRFSSAKAKNGDSVSDRKEAMVAALMKSKRAGTVMREESCAVAGVPAPADPERVRGSAPWNGAMMSSLARVKTGWPEEGSDCRAVVRARWMAARWSRAERKVSKRPADASLQNTLATAAGVKVMKSDEAPSTCRTVAGSEERSHASSMTYETAQPGSTEVKESSGSQGRKRK